MADTSTSAKSYAGRVFQLVRRPLLGRIPTNFALSDGQIVFGGIVVLVENLVFFCDCSEACRAPKLWQSLVEPF